MRKIKRSSYNNLPDGKYECVVVQFKNQEDTGNFVLIITKADDEKHIGKGVPIWMKEYE